VRVVVDTNVLVSGILSGGIPYKIIELWKNGEIEVCYASKILREYNRVLSYPKFKLPLSVIADLLVFITESGKKIELKTKINVIKEDPFDNVFLSCAVDSNCQFVITGDKHLLNLQEFRNIKIVLPRQFFSILKNL
jgi:uncharacterized protein